MASETFDQRFKRLTGDMLMLDICRTLGIEVRDLMKIRSGVRVTISMDRLRRLCQDQGLDFGSFTRDYDAPWSSELKTPQVITSDSPAPTPRQATAEAQIPKRTPARFRPDGSRIVESPTSAGKHEEPARPRRLSQLPIVTNGNQESKPSVVSRIKAVMASAANLLTETLPERGDDLVIEHDDAQAERNVYQTQSVTGESFAYPEPQKLPAVGSGSGENATVQTIMVEVADLRREVSALSSRLNQLLGR
jgi:hypothetical protein